MTRARLNIQLILAVLILAATSLPPANAQNSPIYLVTYVEVEPNVLAAGVPLLQRYRDTGRKEDGNLRFDVLHETGHLNRFAILELWKDQFALDTHTKAESTLQFRKQLEEIQSAPYDERVLQALYVGSDRNERRAGMIYVLTHVDVMPSYEEDSRALLKAMHIDSVKDRDNISFNVLQQANRTNHFTIVDEWTNRGALDAHDEASHTRTFRERLSPMEGALYDERFYEALD